MKIIIRNKSKRQLHEYSGIAQTRMELRANLEIDLVFEPWERNEYESK